MKKINKKKFFNTTPEIIHPLKAIEIAESIPTGLVFPFTCEINNHAIPTLMIICDSTDIDFFGISYPPPQPLTKYRMLDLGKTDFMIEIVLFFENRKVLRLQLNPLNKIVKEYLATAIRTEIVGIQFILRDTGQKINSFTDLNKEQVEWFTRNLKLAKALKVNKRYDELSNLVRKQMNEHLEKSYEFYPVTDENVLADRTDKLIKFEQTKSFKSK